MNSRAPISGLESPSRASRATCASCAVSSPAVSTLRLRAVSPVAWSSRAARSANAVGAHRGEQLVRGAQVRAAVEPAAGPAQPLAVEQVRARQVRARACAAEALDRLAIGRLRLLAVAAAARACGPRRRAPSRCRWPTVASRNSSSAAGAASTWPAARRGLDELDERLGRTTRPDDARDARCAAASASLVAAEAVVEDRGGVLGERDRALLAARGGVSDRRLDARRARRPRRRASRRAASAASVSGALPTASAIASASSSSVCAPAKSPAITRLAACISSACGRIVSAPASRASATWRADSTCQLSSSHRLRTRATKDLDIALDQSWMIGDRYGDVELAHNAGLHSALVLSGYGRGEWENQSSLWQYQPDLVADNLLEAVKSILQSEQPL